MLCLDRYTNMAWVGLTNGVINGYNLVDNVPTHYLYSSGYGMYGYFATCGCPLSSINHVSCIDSGLFCFSPYNVDFISRNGGSPTPILTKDFLVTLPDNSHISTSVLSPNSIYLSVYSYLFTIDPESGKQTSCATLKNPITVLSTFHGESSHTLCSHYRQNPEYKTVNIPFKGQTPLIPESYSSRYPQHSLIAVGSMSGSIELFDYRENESVVRILGHKSRLLDIACNNYHIASIGLSAQSAYEPIVQLHDLRMLKSHLSWLGSPVNMVKFLDDKRYIAVGCNQYHMCNVDGTKTSHRVQNLKPGVQLSTYILSFALRNDLPPDRIDNITFLHSDFSITLEKISKVESNLEESLKSKLSLNAEQKLPPFNTLKNATDHPQLLSVFPDDYSNVVAQFLFFTPGVTNILSHVCLADNCFACILSAILKILSTQNEEIIKYKSEEKESQADTPEPSVISGSRRYVISYKISSLLPKSTNMDSFRQDIIHLLDNVHKNLNNITKSTLIHDIFGVYIESRYKCSKDHHIVSHLTTNSLRVKLYENEDKLDFYQIFTNNLNTKSTANAFCKTCVFVSEIERYAKILKFSNIILVECMGLSKLWKEVSIPSHFFLKTTDTGLNACKELAEDEEGTKYILCGLLSYYDESANVKFAADTMAKIFGFKTSLIAHSYVNDKWVVFSGTYMDYSTLEQAVDFTHPYRYPVALLFKKENLDPIESLKPQLDTPEASVISGNRCVPIPIPTTKCPVPCTVFLNDKNVAHNLKLHNQPLTFTPLSIDEIEKITTGDFVLALDIECVSGDLEKREFCIPKIGAVKIESNIEVIPPKTTPVPILARVSMVRASGSSIGIPFIDHYIYHKLPPKDYLTRYSGLFSGDLDLLESKHWLTTRKSIYMKIRYLVDAGCRFIGHGITNDFKMLNIAVPRSQIIDTVELYRLPGQRYISLQFLAAYLLKKRIQRQVHDSVQDAVTSLQLYKLYLKASENGTFPNLVKNLYQIGHNTNWRIPQ